MLEVEVGSGGLVVWPEARWREQRLLQERLAAVLRALLDARRVEAHVPRGADRREPLRHVLHALLERRAHLQAALLAHRHRTRVVRVAQLTRARQRRSRLREELVDPLHARRLQTQCQRREAQTRRRGRSLPPARGIRFGRRRCSLRHKYTRTCKSIIMCQR